MVHGININKAYLMNSYVILKQGTKTKQKNRSKEKKKLKTFKCEKYMDIVF